MLSGFPERIVCLTEETTEWLYLLGEEARIVGISGYTVRPPQARQEKPRVSAFLSARIDQILALEPDLVLGFSDLQADIASTLIRAGVPVHVFNHRTVEGILASIQMVGAMVGAHERTAVLIAELQAGLLAEGASLYDPANISLMHHVYAALRAHHLYHRDQHYVVQNGEVVIVDEFTGRLMSAFAVGTILTAIVQSSTAMTSAPKRVRAVSALNVSVAALVRLNTPASTPPPLSDSPLPCTFTVPALLNTVLIVPPPSVDGVLNSP